MQRIETEALLLRKVAYGETDLVVTFLTEQVGKVSAIARGGRVSAKRLGGALEPFHTIHVTLDDRGRELRTLREARLVAPRLNLVGNLECLEAAGEALRWARHLLPVRTPEPEAWSIVNALLDALDQGESRPRAALAGAGLRLLAAVGYALDLERCVRCGKPAPEGSAAYINATRGGIVCTACGGASRRLSSALRAAAAQAARGLRPEMTPHEADVLLAIVEEAMAAHTDFDAAGAR